MPNNVSFYALIFTQILWMYKILLKPIFFLFPAESIHNFTGFFLSKVFSLSFIKPIVSVLYNYQNKDLGLELFGLQFRNPVGLAAGFDKNAKYFQTMDAFGFGFVEVGTVTPRPQDGNPKPRLFRLKKDEALINRMGFNNDGVASLKRQLQTKKRNVVIGVNIGKNKDTSLENAVNDYTYCFEHLFDEADYFVVNVSSPNTPNLRNLQDKEPLRKILSALCDLNKAKKKAKPLLLKIAPDLTNGQLDDIIELVLDLNLDGIIATNTTISREGLKESDSSLASIGNGGLSGKPLKNRSTEVIKYIHEKSKASITIIGVGGIQNADDVREKMEAGASLIQIYSGFVFEGPSMVKRILKKLN